MRREVIGDCVLYCGDCRDVLPTLGMVDSVVTDPPYELNFMGRSWDRQGIVFRPETWQAVFRPLKEGGRLLAFGGTRTHHRIWCAIEDAGFVVEDTIAWLHGQGFPKHKSKLKPAFEPVCVAVRPGRGVLPLGIEECRIETADNLDGGAYAARGNRHDLPGADRSATAAGMLAAGKTTGRQFVQPAGRWPANVILSHIDGPDGCRCVGTKRVKGSNGVRGASTKIYGGGKGFTEATGEEVGYADPDGMEEVPAWECHPECPVKLLDTQSGERRSSPSDRNTEESSTNTYGWAKGGIWKSGVHYGDTGGASRFFYTPKASKSDRGEGNSHPTVKATALMEWLVKLICPPGGIVLDPFMGSGSTALACIRSGRRFVGCELNPEYFEIACKRIRSEYAQNPLFEAI